MRYEYTELYARRPFSEALESYARRGWRVILVTGNYIDGGDQKLFLLERRVRAPWTFPLLLASIMGALAGLAGLAGIIWK